MGEPIKITEILKNHGKLGLGQRIREKLSENLPGSDTEFQNNPCHQRTQVEDMPDRESELQNDQVDQTTRDEEKPDKRESGKYNPYTDRKLKKSRYKLVVFWKKQFRLNDPSFYWMGQVLIAELKNNPKVNLNLANDDESELIALNFKLNGVQKRTQRAIIYDRTAKVGEEDRYAEWYYMKEVFHINKNNEKNNKEEKKTKK